MKKGGISAALTWKRPLRKKRTWRQTGLGQNLLSGCKNTYSGTLFTFVSYNVLSDTLLKEHGDVYGGTNLKYLDWEFRWSLLCCEVESLRPDIVAFQEVEAAHYETYFKLWFESKGFNSIFKKRTGNKPDGCAIFFNKVFDLISYENIEFFQPETYLNRDNIALLVKLKPKEGRSFCVATTHLLYNLKRSDVRLGQIAYLFAELDKFCYEGLLNGLPHYCPIVLAGDFNANPHNEVISFIVDGVLDYRQLNHTKGEYWKPPHGISSLCQHINSTSNNSGLHGGSSSSFGPTISGGCDYLLDNPNLLQHKLNLHSVYYHLRSTRSRMVTSLRTDWECVDYLFYSKTMSRYCQGTIIEGPLKLIERYELFNYHEACLIGSIPNAVYPSDHFPLAAKFLIKD